VSWLTFPLLVALMTPPAAEPAPRPLPRAPLRIDSPLTHVSAARELADGRVLITNAKEPALLVLDPSTGTLARLGEAGAGGLRYAQPGGLYAGPQGSTLLLDRGQSVITISAGGELQDSRSVAVRGRRSASDADVDHQRPDARGFVYFVDGRGGVVGREATLVRFDPDTAKMEPITKLLKPEVRTLPGGDGVVFGRTVIGSPADGWGVAPDGRVAVVRAVPYRVDWHAPDGKVTQGLAIPTDPLPMTAADRQAFIDAAGPGVSVGRTGGQPTNLAKLGTLFADTKPPFTPEGVLVSPDARAWVLRTRAHEATAVIYDVFDASGRRVDRIELPDDSRIVGFGRNAVLVRWTGDAGRCELRRYRLR